MKKILGIAVAAMFVMTATAVLAADQKAAPKKEEVKVNVVEKTAAGTETTKIEAKGNKATMKVTEPGTKVTVKRDYKAECTAKLGAKAKDADLNKCIEEAKKADEAAVVKAVEAEKAAPTKTAAGTAKAVEKKADTKATTETKAVEKKAEQPKTK